jgi:hypothetical protein
MAYDIFISYRRKGAGAGVAGELQAKLENRGYKVFLDVDEIGSGPFPVQIDQAIEECKDFLLVLAPGTLDRCANEGDWVRREIMKAESLDKNLVGVMLPGFVMPEAESLPEPLQSLPSKQVFLWSHEYRTASFEKIEENLVSTKLKKQRSRKKLMVLLPMLLLALVAGGVAVWAKKPHVEPEIKTEPEVVNTYKVEFEGHVGKAQQLTSGLPSAAQFDDNFMQYIENEQQFRNLMDAIAEYDSALMLKKNYPDQIIDSVGVEKLQNKTQQLRTAYMRRIMEDVNDLIKADWGQYTSQDMSIAKILATPEDKHRLDSLTILIENLGE